MRETQTEVLFGHVMASTAPYDTIVRINVIHTMQTNEFHSATKAQHSDMHLGTTFKSQQTPEV